MDVFYSIGIAGAIILIGVLFAVISKKINYPLILLLLVVGLILSPITGVFNPFQFQPVIEAFVTFTLVIVLFQVGYNTKFSELKENFAPTIWITLVSIFFTVILCTLLGIFVLKLDLLHAILLSSLLASTDVTIVSPLLNNLSILPRMKSYLQLESSLNSVIAAIIAITVINLIQIGSDVTATVKLFLSNIFVGIGLGIVLGYLIYKIVIHLNMEEKPHIIAIGSVLLAYGVAEFFGASGILTALVIGMIFGNAKSNLPKSINVFGSELQMILLTFVYVLLGAFIKFEFFITAGWYIIPFLFVLIFARYLMAKIGLKKMDSYSKSVAIMTGPRGMVSALLILSSATLFSNSELILGIGFSIILVTSVIVLFIPLLPKPKFFKEAEIKKRTEPTPGIENNTLNQEAKNIVKKAQKKVDNSQILKTR